GVNDDDVGPRLAQGVRGDVAGGPVGAVDGDPQTLERAPGRRDQVVDVAAVRGLGVLLDAAHAVARGALPVGVQAGLDGVLERVGELEATAGEELDAVVRHRVVRGGDDHAEVDVQGGGQVRDAGRRQHPDVD